MSDLLKDGGTAVLDLLRNQGVPAVTTSLEKLSDEATEEWQKILLRLGVSLVSEHGVSGLDILGSMVSGLQEGKNVDLSMLSMQDASNLLAIMQRREADTRNKIALFTQVIIEAVGQALSTLVSILFKEIKL